MKAKLTEAKCRSALGRVGQLFSLVVWLGAVILICSAASAQNMFVSGTNPGGGEIFKFSWDGKQSIFASGLHYPGDLAVDSAGNLFVADNSIGNIYQGSIYKYKPDGSRVTIAVLDPGDRPADLALDGMGNLYMADLGGKIYRYDLGGALRRQGRTTFGSVPNSAQSLAFDSAGNLFVVDVGDVNGSGNAIYEFTTQGARSTFAKGEALDETFSYVAFQPMPSCCQ